jgi:hypothetical protein
VARRRRSEPATPEARQIARAIGEGKRQGLTNREIGEALGINERTVRKVRAGETSGVRTYKRVMQTPKTPRRETGLFNAEFVVGYTSTGESVVASRNVTISRIRNADGSYREPTPLDVFRVRGLAVVAAQERIALLQRYGNVATVAGTDSPIKLRKIGSARKATTVIRTEQAS